MRNIFYNLSVALVALFLVTDAYSDNSPSIFQTTKIEKATLTLGRNGEASTLRFRLTNNSIGNITFLGVKSQVSQGSRIIVKLDEGKFVELESISIPSEETLDVNSSHIVLELIGVTDDLKEKGTIKLNLVLARGAFPFIAHIEDGTT